MATEATHKMSQRSSMKQIFLDNPNIWIPLPRILNLHIAQFGARILELRREGMNIENKIQVIHGQRCSWYKYTPNISVQYEGNQQTFASPESLHPSDRQTLEARG